MSKPANRLSTAETVFISDWLRTHVADLADSSLAAVVERINEAISIGGGDWIATESNVRHVADSLGLPIGANRKPGDPAAEIASLREQVAALKSLYEIQRDRTTRIGTDATKLWSGLADRMARIERDILEAMHRLELPSAVNAFTVNGADRDRFKPDQDPADLRNAEMLGIASGGAGAGDEA